MESVILKSRSEHEIDIIKGIIIEAKQRVECTTNATELRMLQDKIKVFETNLMRRLERERKSIDLTVVYRFEDLPRMCYQKRKI